MQKEEYTRWAKSIFVTIMLFALFVVYLILRRGYLNLYIINKACGSVAAVLAGITLLIGPLAHRYAIFERVMPIRRHLGLLALFMALPHVILSTLFLQKFFPPAWYSKEWIPALFGTIAILLWFYLAYLSSNGQIQRMGANLWKKHQQTAGHLAFVAIFLHLTIMKFAGWKIWFMGQTKQTALLKNPAFPPASLFVFFFLLTVLVYRIFRSIKK